VNVCQFEKRETETFTVFCILLVFYNTLSSEKNIHSYFLSYLHELCVDLNTNCSEYTQEKVDYKNVEIRYSLRPMT